MVRNNRVQIVLILLFFLGAMVFAQDKPSNEGQKLREKILAIYQSGGEQGLRDFVKRQKDKISNEFIVEFAQSGRKERNEEWLKICGIMAEEKKDKKTLADVLFKAGVYFRLISANKKATDYFDKALHLYIKLNDTVGQGNIYFSIGAICSDTLDYKKAFEMYEKAIHFFIKAVDFRGQGNVYMHKGNIYLYTGDYSRAVNMYDKALRLFEKDGWSLGQGNVYMFKGKVYVINRDNFKAIEMYDKALLFYEKIGEPIGQGNVHLLKGDIFSEKEEFSKALEMYDKAIFFLEKARHPIGQGNVYLQKSKIYYLIDENSKALQMSDKALFFFEKAGHLIGQGNVYLKKGEIYHIIGEYSKALQMCEKALTCFEKTNYPLGQGNLCQIMGDIFLGSGKNLKAFEMYGKALALFEKTGMPYYQGYVYLKKGDFFLRIGSNSKAFEMYDKALSFFKTNLNKGYVYERKAEIYLGTGENSKGLEMNNKAMSFFKKASDPLGQGNAYWCKGEIFLKTGENFEALKMYEKALDIYKKIGTPRGQGNVYNSIGFVYSKIGNNSRALEMYNKALLIYKKLGDIDSESAAEHGKAKALVKLGKRKKALALFEKGIANLEKVRKQTTFSEMKQIYMGKVYEQYNEVVFFMLENNYYKKGFRYAEAMKSRVFLDQMSEGLVRLEKGLKSELKEERDKLVGKLSALTKQIQETSGKNEKKLKQLKNEYRQVESQFEDLLIKIRLENPLYAEVNYPQPVSVRDLQTEVLKKGETLLTYFISPERAYAFIISKENFSVKQLKVKEKEINSYVERYLHSIKENNTNDMNRFGSKLYEKLFRPMEKYLKKSREIIIVPAGKLETIPFESFILGKKESGQPVFLLEKYRMKYLQSASLLSILRKHYRRDNETQSFIGFGDPVYDYKNFKQGKPELGSMKILATESTEVTENSSLTHSPHSPYSPKSPEDEIKEIHRHRYARAGGIMDRLPHSGEEIKIIARFFEKESLKSVVHLREQAVEDNAKAAYMKDFDYIHFSCHGLLNDDFQSLVLSQLPPDKSKEDGYFTLNEIMNCDYNAKLVVLSACETGSGKMYKGEGITGLTRAVMYAGTPAVVASLWKVDDEATKELMINFYQNMLEKNLDKAEALRQAKLELINNKKYRSSLFWSAFVMYGE